MKSILSFCILALSWTLLGAQAFQGTVERQHSLQGDRLVRFTILNEQALMRPEGTGLADVKIVSDLAAGEYFLAIFQPGGDQVLQFPLPANPLVDGIHAEPYTLTGNSQIIDGFVCQEVLTQYEGQSATAWVATELAALNPAKFVTPQNLQHATLWQIKDLPGLILKFSGTDPQSGQAFTLRHTVQAGSVTSSAFALPPVTQSMGPRH